MSGLAREQISDFGARSADFLRDCTFRKFRRVIVSHDPFCHPTENLILISPAEALRRRESFFKTINTARDSGLEDGIPKVQQIPQL